MVDIKAETPNHLIEGLVQAGLIKEIIGPIPESPKILIPTWAKHPAGMFFHAFTALASKLSTQKPTAFVEDTFPRVLFDKTSDQQAALNITYEDMFRQHGCNVLFSSSFLQEATNGRLIEEIFKMHSKLNWKHFEKLLPEGKRSDLDSINTAELLHASIQSLALDILSRDHDMVLMGGRSRATAVEHRRISKSPMTAILLPVFTSDVEVQKYIDDLNKF